MWIAKSSWIDGTCVAERATRLYTCNTIALQTFHRLFRRKFCGLLCLHSKLWRSEKNWSSGAVLDKIFHHSFTKTQNFVWLINPCKFRQTENSRNSALKSWSRLPYRYLRRYIPYLWLFYVCLEWLGDLAWFRLIQTLRAFSVNPNIGKLIFLKHNALIILDLRLD